MGLDDTMAHFIGPRRFDRKMDDRKMIPIGSCRSRLNPYFFVINFSVFPSRCRQLHESLHDCSGSAS